jgi:hypothetical protein
MDIGFVNFGPLAWSRSPRIRFLSIGSRFCSTLSSDPSSRTSPLRFANPSPPSGWVEDFHLQASGHTRHTKHTAPLGQPDRELRLLQTYCPAGAAGSGAQASTNILARWGSRIGAQASPQKRVLGCGAGAASGTTAPTPSRPYRAFHCFGRHRLRHYGLQTYCPSGAAGYERSEPGD